MLSGCGSSHQIGSGGPTTFMPCGSSLSGRRRRRPVGQHPSWPIAEIGSDVGHVVDGALPAFVFELNAQPRLCELPVAIDCIG
jgi:hypothetical protein